MRTRTRWVVGAAVVVAALIGWGIFSGARNLVNGFRAANDDSIVVGDRVLSMIRDGAYGTLWDEAAPQFHRAVSREKWVAFLGTVDANVGKPRSWTSTGFNRRWNNGVTTTVYTYKVLHERGGSTISITVDATQRLLHLGVNFDMK